MQKNLKRKKKKKKNQYDVLLEYAPGFRGNITEKVSD